MLRRPHAPARLAAVLLLLFAVVSPSLAQILTGKVVGVTDGDTIKVVTADKTLYKIRLNAVDCPETGQPWGSVAKQFTSKFAFGKTAQVKVTDTDRYGRTVGVVTVDGKSLNQSLVKNGMAWWYRKYAPTDTTLKQLEYEARKAKIGIWSEKTAVAPWDWRKGSRPVTKVAAAPRPAARGGVMGTSRPAFAIPDLEHRLSDSHGEQVPRGGLPPPR